MEAMLNSTGDALAQGGALPTRFLTWFYGNGVDLNKWEPDNPGSSSWNPSVLRQDIADVKDYVTVCTGLDNMSRNPLARIPEARQSKRPEARPLRGCVS
jgi:hypothetical protein